LLTLIAGLPSAQQIVTILDSWHLIRFDILFTTKIIYLSIIALAIVSIIWQLMPTYGRKLISSFDQSHLATKKHFMWPKMMRFSSARKQASNSNTSKPISSDSDNDEI
jgi:hypothetical protein